MATCVWCGWLHPCYCCLHPFFPPVPAIVWHCHHCWCGGDCCASVMWCCVMWWCTHKSLEIYIFLLKLFQPALNTSHDLGSNQHFLTHCISTISTHATTNTNSEWPPALFLTPMPGMTKAGVDGQTGGLKMCPCLEPQVSSYFFIHFFALLMIFSYN